MTEQTTTPDAPTIGGYRVFGTTVLGDHPGLLIDNLCPGLAQAVANSGNDDGRTFFVATEERDTLNWLVIAHKDDPRSAGMWPMRDGEHVGWWVPKSGLTVTPFEAREEPDLRPGQWITWGGKVYLHRVASVKDGMVYTDQMRRNEPGSRVIEGTSVLEFSAFDGLEVIDEEEPEQFPSGAWFTWGTQEVWYRVARRDGDRIHTDARVYRNSPNPAESMPESWNVDLVSETLQVVTNRADLPGAVQTKVEQFEGTVTPPEPITAEEGRSTGPHLHFEADPDKVRELEETIENLRGRIESGERLAMIRRREHEEDIAKISERLNDEAEMRGWCSEYDRIVEDLSGSLNVELTPRKRTFEVEVQATYTTTISVEAQDEDEAEQRVAEGDFTVEVDHAVRAHYPDEVEVLEVTEA